jgi:hypothetical protein
MKSQKQKPLAADSKTSKKLAQRAFGFSCHVKCGEGAAFCTNTAVVAVARWAL